MWANNATIFNSHFMNWKISYNIQEMSSVHYCNPSFMVHYFCANLQRDIFSHAPLVVGEFF